MKNMRIKPMMTLVAIVFLACSPRIVAASKDGAKRLLEQFVDLDIHGTRLNLNGWLEADKLFVNTSHFPSRPTIVVISANYAISDLPNAQGNPQYYMGYEELGRIDSRLHFSPAAPAKEIESFYKFDLVQQQSYTRGWKIKGSQPTEVHLTVASAINYLKEQGDKTRDPSVRSNANQALEALKRFRRVAQVSPFLRDLEAEHCSFVTDPHEEQT